MLNFKSVSGEYKFLQSLVDLTLERPVSPVGFQFLKVSQKQTTTFYLIFKLFTEVWGFGLHYFASVSIKTNLVQK